MKGQVIGGELGRIIIRQKAAEQLQLGELLIAEHSGEKILLQVYELVYGSQISPQNLELISGMHLEGAAPIEFLDAELRNYVLAFAKPLLALRGDDAALCKTLPPFFAALRTITRDDVAFLGRPAHALFVGRLRSGSSVLDVDIFLPAEEVLSHHILVPATTGRGKSNLTSVMLWSVLHGQFAGMLVLDPHDEYYGRTGLGLKDHPDARTRLAYYTPSSPPPGARSLKISITDIRPKHFDGVAGWSDAQQQAVHLAYSRFGKGWIQRLLTADENAEEAAGDTAGEAVVEAASEGGAGDLSLFHPATIAVVKRKLMGILGIRVRNGGLSGDGIFSATAGTTTVSDICSELEQGKIVVVDTSSCSSSVEILVGSMLVAELLGRYQRYKREGTLAARPVVSVVLEEAPRVLGKEVLEKGSNIFDTIAREGRKFRIGLLAITQLPSAIPRSILANMNTKIILGLEMKPERDAIIDSAAQDLSSDSRNIASLDKGEAIITSTFTRFAIPVRVPLLGEMVRGRKQEKVKTQREFAGISTSQESIA